MADYKYYTSDEKDIADLLAIDVRSFFVPYRKGMWKRCVKAYWCRHIANNRKAVAFAIGSLLSNDVTCYRIIKLAVHPTHRRQKFSGFLLDKLNEEAHKHPTVKYLDCWIPESMTSPKYPEWDIRPWLDFYGFEAFQVATDMFTNCNQKEDGFRWRRPLTPLAHK